MASVEAERKLKKKKQLISKSQFDNTNNMFLVLPKKHKQKIAKLIGNIYGDIKEEEDSIYLKRWLH